MSLRHVFLEGARLCNTLQHTATHCNTQHSATTWDTCFFEGTTHCNTLQQTAKNCNTLQNTATHCNTLQHTTQHKPWLTMSFKHVTWIQLSKKQKKSATICRLLQISWLVYIVSHVWLLFLLETNRLLFLLETLSEMTIRLAPLPFRNVVRNEMTIDKRCPKWNDNFPEWNANFFLEQINQFSHFGSFRIRSLRMGWLRLVGSLKT